MDGSAWMLLLDFPCRDLGRLAVIGARDEYVVSIVQLKIVHPVEMDFSRCYHP